MYLLGTIFSCRLMHSWCSSDYFQQLDMYVTKINNSVCVHDNEYFIAGFGLFMGFVDNKRIYNTAKILYIVYIEPQSKAISNCVNQYDLIAHR